MGMEDRDLDMCPLSAIEEDSERSHFYLSRTSNLPPTRAPSHRRSITPFPAHQPISRSNTISEPPPPSREDIRHRREKFEQKKEEDRRDWDSHKSQRERDRYNTEKISMREKRDKKEKEQRDRERMEYVADTPPSRRDTDAKDKDGKTGGCTQQ